MALMLFVAKKVNAIVGHFVGNDIFEERCLSQIQDHKLQLLLTHASQIHVGDGFFHSD